MNLPNGHYLQKGKYRLTHIVGQGGFGITYKGVWFTEVKGPLGRMKTEVPVCIKEYFFKDYCYRDADSFAVKVHSETGRTLFNKFKEKLIKEAKILSEVHHPYIVNVLEVFEENDTAYIAMEYISGFSLKHLMEKEGILPEAKVLKYVRQIGEALQFVHEKNILHLDIKPSNILIDKNDNARLIDFGVSKRYDIEQQETSTTLLTLSKGFASIEQYDNEGTQNFSPCPDIYSLGATMYNLLTGKIPTESILRATRSLAKPSEINAAISPKTEIALLKAMEIIPADRFQTVAEMMDALDLPPLEKQISSPSASTRPALQPDEEEETTLLTSSSLPPFSSENETDEDETIVNTPIGNNLPGEIPPQPVTKRGHRRVWMTMLSLILALMASAVAFWVHSNKPDQPDNGEIKLPGSKLEAEDGYSTLSSQATRPLLAESVATESGNSEPATTELETTRQEITGQETAKPTTPAADQHRGEEKQTDSQKPSGNEAYGQEPAGVETHPQEASLPETASAVDSAQPREKRSTPPEELSAVRLPATEVETVRQPAKLSTVEIESQYMQLIGSGKSKMAAKDYSAAKKDFTKAKELKLTEEVVRLLITCDEKSEARKIEERRALYEEKMDFGKYRIVRKRATGRYGAIDKEANEWIPCKYVNVGKAENEGRAFERDDNLFDIYNAEGILISKGATYY